MVFTANSTEEQRRAIGEDILMMLREVVG